MTRGSSLIVCRRFEISQLGGRTVLPPRSNAAVAARSIGDGYPPSLTCTSIGNSSAKHRRRVLLTRRSRLHNSTRQRRPRPSRAQRHHALQYRSFREGHTRLTHDAQGQQLSGATAEAARLFDRAVHAFNIYRGDPVALLDQAIQVAPDFSMAHLMKAYLMGLATEPEATAEALRIAATVRTTPLSVREG